MMKKLIPIACSTLLTAGLAAGCKGGAEEGASNGTGTARPAALTSIPLPIVKGPFTIDYWRPTDAKLTASLDHFGEMAAYRKKEELTGVHVNWTHPPLGQHKDQFNLLLATNDMPDVIYYNWSEAVGGPEKMLADGRIIRLNDYIAAYAPNLKKLMESDPDIKKQITLDDGTIYMFPYIRSDARKLAATVGMVIRKDWLDRLNLKVPTTIDEWYAVLKAFREKDPNGNGKPDELPFSGSSGPGNLTKLHDFAPAFGVLGGMQFRDGRILYGPVQPEYKKFLETMAQWYAEGLIDPGIKDNDAKTFDSKVTDNRIGAFFGGVFSGIGKYQSLMAATNSKFELTGAPWPKGSEGKPYSTFGLQTKVLPYGEAITASADKAKLPAIVQWMDFNYSPQGHDLFNFGIEGDSYTLEGGAVRFTDKITTHSKLTIDQALAAYALSIMDGPMNQDSRYLDAAMTFQGQREANSVWMKGDDSLVVPSVRFTEDESRLIATVMTPITAYVNEMMTQFIMGNTPLSEFDTFTQTIRKMGIDQMVHIHEEAYKRYSSR
ncbi:ABC transporter substrate-binding protein [Gorillibacterium sp. sgz5001074]|uniref:ABC transporter substrate-binding protein n=1 Tax=Gorillibacterium sp. sgz5001074 TaxID=3446695 RepID=UPI003F661D27